MDSYLQSLYKQRQMTKEYFAKLRSALHSLNRATAAVEKANIALVRAIKTSSH